MASFNEDILRKKLDDLNMSQQSIQTLSLWLIHHKKHAAMVVNAWYKELTKVPDNRKLAFMYLANDVIQNSKKKGPEYNKEFGHKLSKAFRHLATIKLDEKASRGINRLLQVWEERGVFDANLIKDFKKRAVKKSVKRPTPTESSSSENVKKKKKKLEQELDSHFPSAYEDEQIEPEECNEAQSPLSVRALPPPSPVIVEPVKVAPEPDLLIKALQDLENAATADADVRKKIASLPPAVSDVNTLKKLTDSASGRKLVTEVDDAMLMLEEYNRRLYDEMDSRKSVAKMLHEYIYYQKDCLLQTEETLEEHKQKLASVQKVRKELKAHLQNLPDISKLPNVGGNLAPLPSAGDLFT